MAEWNEEKRGPRPAHRPASEWEYAGTCGFGPRALREHRRLLAPWRGAEHDIVFDRLPSGERYVTIISWRRIGPPPEKAVGTQPPGPQPEVSRARVPRVKLRKGAARWRGRRRSG